MRTPTPPKDLGAAGRKLWRAITAEHDLEPRELAILLEAARQVDALESLAAALAKDGHTVTGAAGQTRLHPAITEARQGRLALGRLLDLLHLPAEEGEPRKDRAQQRRISKRWSA